MTETLEVSPRSLLVHTKTKVGNHARRRLPAALKYINRPGVPTLISLVQGSFQDHSWETLCSQPHDQGKVDHIRAKFSSAMNKVIPCTQDGSAVLQEVNHMHWEKQRGELDLSTESIHDNAANESNQQLQQLAVRVTKAPGAPKRFKSSFIFFSTWKHGQIREKMRREGTKKKVMPEAHLRCHLKVYSNTAIACIRRWSMWPRLFPLSGGVYLQRNEESGRTWLERIGNDLKKRRRNMTDHGRLSSCRSSHHLATQMLQRGRCRHIWHTRTRRGPLSKLSILILPTPMFLRFSHRCGRKRLRASDDDI